MRFSTRYQTSLLLALFSLILYFIFAYHLERHNFLQLLTLYSGLFVLAYFIINRKRLEYWFLTGIGVFFRLIFIFAIPNLSQDFYRFLWDGRLVAQGVSPYLFTPTMFFENSLTLDTIPGLLAGAEVTMPQAHLLYSGMGSLSAGNFSNYMPLNQFIFAIAAIFTEYSVIGSVLILRIFIILADVGILFYGQRILKRLEVSRRNIYWYFLNPFIIIELTGNLHFEGVMLFFLLWGLYSLFKGKYIWAATIIGISISVKLLPLLLLPLFINYFYNTKRYSAKNPRKEELPFQGLVRFYAMTAAVVIFTFLPFLSFEFLQNYFSTLSLWFQNFEFNGSIYYVIRWIGYQIYRYNIIATIGKILPVIVVLFILGLVFYNRKKNANERAREQLFTAMLFAVSFYFLLSTTVHPWYIATPLLISIFTKYKFPIVWSFLIMLSYSAYGVDSFHENLWLVAIEYIIVIAFALWEIRYQRPQKRRIRISEKELTTS